MRKTAVILGSLVLAVLLTGLLPIVNANASTINVSGGAIPALGSTTTVNIVLDEAPNGLLGYYITVTIPAASAGVADITGLAFPAWPGMTDSSGPPSDASPADSVWIKGWDSNDQVEPGDGDLDNNIDLGTLTIKSQAEGDFEFDVTINLIQEDDGTAIYPSVVSGTLRVDTIPPTVTLSDDHPDLIVKDADTVEITAGFNENMAATPTISIDVSTGGDADIVAFPMSGAGMTWTYNWNVPAGHSADTATVTVAGNDLAGHAYAGADTIVYTIDNTPPTLTTVSIASDNADPTLAIVLDTVTISFTADEVLVGLPTVTIDGNAADAVTNPSGNNYTATRVMQTLDTEGAIGFTINFTDEAGNAGTEVTATTDTSSVIFDETAPTLTPVTIASDNADPTLAIVLDTVTLSFTADEALIGLPTVTIDGNAADAVTNPSGNNYTATRVMQTLDTEGAIGFTINFTDEAGNAGTEVTATTDTSSVIFDETAPTLTPVTIASDNADPTLAIVLDTVTISFTADEALIGTPTVKIDGNAADAVNDLGGNAYSATREMQVLDTEAAIAFTIDFTDAAGNPGIQVTATTDSSSVAFEKTLPIIPGPHGVPPRDLDLDENGLYEDLNGNEVLDFADVVLFFDQMDWIEANEPVSCFDFNGNGRIDYDDIVTLFGMVT